MAWPRQNQQTEPMDWLGLMWHDHGVVIALGLASLLLIAELVVRFGAHSRLRLPGWTWVVGAFVVGVIMPGPVRKIVIVALLILVAIRFVVGWFRSRRPRGSQPAGS